MMARPKEIPAGELAAAYPGINDMINKTRAHLFKQKGSGFLGCILARTRLIWTRDLPTAAINVTTLYWNPDFFMSLSNSSRVTVLAHELWHIGFLHLVRRGDRCPDYWNQAGDHVINLLLEEQGYDMSGFPYLMDPQFKGMSTDEVFDIIAKDGPKPNDFMAGDIIISFGDSPDGDQDDEDGQGSGGMSEQAIKDMMVKIVIEAKTAATMSSRDAGSIPGEITMVIDKFLNPKLPWNVILYNFFNAMANDDYSFARPNRRYGDPIVPGKMSRNGLDHLFFLIDASGSMTDEHVVLLNSEVKFIQEQLNPERLTLIIFDTEIRKTYEFERDQSFDNIEIVGRGGTDLNDCYDFIRKHRPTAACIMTDLYVDIPADTGVPVIWVVVDNPSATVPYGKLVHLN